MPFRAESSSFRAYSARKPFPFHVCTMDDMLLFYHLERLFFRNTNKMGRRSTALPPEKSKSLRVLCRAFCVSVSFVFVRLLIPFHQCLFYVGSPVENLAAYLCVRQNAVVTVVLQGSPAYFQQVCHFLVRQQFIAIGRRLPFFQQLFEQGQQPVEIRVERLYPLVVLFSDFITHMLLILGYTLFLKLVQMLLPFQRASLRFSSTFPTTRSTSSGR